MATSEKHILPSLAFQLLQETEQLYKENNQYENLQCLYSIFGKVLIKATELLENGRFVQYETHKCVRKAIKVRCHNEHFLLFPNINFCHCSVFKYKVLQEKQYFTCKHVLATKLAQICNKIKIEVITDEQIAHLLNGQLESTAEPKYII